MGIFYSMLQNSDHTQSEPENFPTTWFTQPPKWHKDHKKELLNPKDDKKPPPDLNLDELISKSFNFPINFPIETMRCYQLHNLEIPKEILERNINSTYPLIHEYGLLLCSIFLNHQKKFGNKKFYGDMSLLDLIERLLSKRAVTFVSVRDYYQLLDGSTGFGDWEKVGTSDERAPLVLENCLSYHEMKLSALLSVSSHTVFVNDGCRNNRGVFEKDREKLENDGVIIGLIGTRLPKVNVMEAMEVLKTKTQNTHQNGFGRFFVPTLQGSIMNFYGTSSLTYKELLNEMKNNPERYADLMNGMYFDKLVYCRRMALSIDTLLIEANDRAKTLNKKSYVHVVGLGLGVWKVYREQDRLFMDTFAERVELLLPTLTNISDLHFAYIKHKKAGKYSDGETIGGITLHMDDKQGPNVRLTGEHEGKLLVVSYAWDSNSLPGNEFWGGSLDTSSDPAAACSTQVAELHNCHVNPKVSAANLRVVTMEGLVLYEEYRRRHQEE